MKFLRFFTVKKVRVVYVAWGLHPDTGRVCATYVGKDSCPPGRANEHMFGGTSRQPHPSPWADTVIHWSAASRGRMTRFGLWWREILWIGLLRPVHNYQWNKRNPRRIPKYVAVRRERSQAFWDARAGFVRPPWQIGRAHV